MGHRKNKKVEEMLENPVHWETFHEHRKKSPPDTDISGYALISIHFCYSIFCIYSYFIQLILSLNILNSKFLLGLSPLRIRSSYRLQILK